ncbi:hypothetical protein LHT11_08900 [Acetobacter indonesiensis]|uniref:hypothetical protein n=1 Tax=Acetobacter indonesiensis TaxID=104101 RepID=UPI001F28EB27|nr:hypothetical protein [Acetobacter indonesiensis]MCG0995318.1 hypothetical protein [Acetobacter indonesiensis]
MPRYQITLTGTGGGRFQAVLTDHSTNWQIVFGDCRREMRNGKQICAGPQTDGRKLWMLEMQKKPDGNYQIDLTDAPHWLIRFDECELDTQDGQQCIIGWADQAEPLAVEKEAA